MRKLSKADRRSRAEIVVAAHSAGALFWFRNTAAECLGYNMQQLEKAFAAHFFCCTKGVVNVSFFNCDFPFRKVLLWKKLKRPPAPRTFSFWCNYQGDRFRELNH